MKYLFSLILFLVTCVSSLDAQEKKFKVFNAMLYKNMPDLKKYGLSDIDVVYELELLSLDPKDKLNRKKRYIDVPKIRNRARSVKSNSNIVCLDVESWNTRIRQGGAESRRKYEHVFDVFKNSNKDKMVGYFGVVPFPHYIEDYHKGTQRNKKMLNDWIDNNHFLESIYNRVDVYFPHFYMGNKDRRVWEQVIKSQIDIISRYKGDKPVYAFIWPQYYNPKDPNLNYQFIDAVTWRFQLETLYKYCDGVVIWGSPYDQNKKELKWNANAGWWKETLSFIERYNIK